MPFKLILPATCELCGQWMPGHKTNCPRSGVHPSQWSTMIDKDLEHIISYGDYVYDELSDKSTISKHNCFLALSIN